MIEQKNKTRNPTFESSWKIRRRIIFSTLLFCAGTIFYIMIWGGDTRVNESIVLGSYALVGAVISSYVFGSVWEDNTTRIQSTGNFTNNRQGSVSIYTSSDTTSTKPLNDEERKKKAMERLERMRANKAEQVDNPDG